VFLRPSVRTYQRGSPCTDFREIWYWEPLTKICRDLCEIWSKSDKNFGNYTWRPKHVYIFNISMKYFAAQTQSILAFNWQLSAVLYCWQLFVGQQNYKRNALLRSGSNNCSADLPQCCFFCSASLLYYLLKRASIKAISSRIVVCVHFLLWANYCLNSENN